MKDIREFWLLARLHLRMRLNLSVLKAGRDKKGGLLKQLAIGMLIVYGAASIIVVYWLFLSPIMKAAIEIGMGDLVFGQVVLASMVMVLTLGTMSLLALVFNARDTWFYISLPIRPRAVFSAKFFMVYLTELVIGFFLLFPSCLIYGGYVNAGILYWCKALVVILLVPIVPMAISSLLASILMRLTAMTRHRDTITTVLSLVLVTGIVVLQVFMQRYFAANDIEKLVNSLLEGKSLLIQSLSFFPPALWASECIVQNGSGAVKGGLLLLLCAAASLGAAVWLAGKLYYRGVLAHGEAAKRTSGGYRPGTVRALGIHAAIFLKEFKVLLRTPVYAMNSIAAILIIPILIFTMGSGFTAGDMGGLPWEYFNSLTDLTLVVSLAIAFAALVNPAVSTALSREGRQIWIMLSMPVSVRTQITAKILVGAVLALAGGLTGLAALYIVFSPPVEVLLYNIPISVVLAFLTAVAGMIPDILRPKLKWNSEAEAMKQNLNAILGIITALVALAIPAAAALLTRQLGAPIWLITTCVVLVGAGECYCLKNISILLAESVFAKLE